MQVLIKTANGIPVVELHSIGMHCFSCNKMLKKHKYGNYEYCPECNRTQAKPGEVDDFDEALGAVWYVGTVLGDTHDDVIRNAAKRRSFKFANGEKLGSDAFWGMVDTLVIDNQIRVIDWRSNEKK